MKVEFSKGELEVDGVAIDHALISTITFKNFLGLTESLSSSSENNRERILTRLRLVEQVQLFPTKGAPIKLDEVKILNLPVKVGLKLVRALNSSVGTPGKIINDGNGIEKPIIFRLGTPIKTKDGVIEELEFLAKTFGDVEDIVCEPNAFKRGYLLITKASKPVSSGYKLLRTSDVLAEQIGMEDGLAISYEVSSLFFD